MGSFGGFYKGDKKKKKKGAEGVKQQGIGAPVFVLPKMVDKKKKNQDW